MKDFYKDLRRYFKQSADYNKIIKAYNTGYITLAEAVKMLLESPSKDSE